ncbi:MAG: hypothetical protein HYU51_11305 [Candidatus Rokubacteria bacterium]|nr:hypothetical protein [Candidatus Rokubacteria bacterium]
MPFTNAYHGPGASEPRDLGGRIDAELRSRIEDAVEYACLDAMVEARRARGAALPVADAPADREEFATRVRDFLERLRATMTAELTDGQHERLRGAIAPPRGDLEAALCAQVALAKELPDYWQRFDTIRRRSGRPSMIRLDPSGRERRSLLDRLLGQG